MKIVCHVGKSSSPLLVKNLTGFLLVLNYANNDHTENICNADRNMGLPTEQKKYDLFKTTKSGNLILERNKPSKINQVIVTKYLCQDKGQTKLKALYPMNCTDRMNCIAGQPEMFVQGN